MEQLCGKWKLQHEKGDNFEDYLKAVGIIYPFRKIAKTLTPEEELHRLDENTWVLKLSASVRHSHLEFKLGVEIPETTLDGRKCQTTFTVEDGHLIQYQRSLSEGVPDTRISRKKSDNNSFTQVYEAVGTGIKCNRKYVRHEDHHHHHHHGNHQNHHHHDNHHHHHDHH